ncbi:MAG: MBL fold metallo-hydrolase [Methanobacterium sp.]
MAVHDLGKSGIMRFESGYYIIRQFMPYRSRLGGTNVFLIDSADGWVVIDVGSDLETNRQVWQQVLKEVGISFKQIQKIYITHCHPDHLGAARWLQQRSEAPVYMLQEEIERAYKYVFLDENNFKQLYRQAICSQLQQNKFPDNLTEQLIEDWFVEVRPQYLEPAEIIPLHEGDIIDLGGSPFKVMPAPAHTDGQYILWSETRQHLFLADVLSADAYLHFTDWPNSNLSNPLEKLFELFDQLKGLGTVKTFPGHGEVIEDLNDQMEKVKNRHLRALDRLEAAVQGPAAAGELYSRLAPLEDYVHHHRVVLGETLGYLEYLVSRQRLIKKYEEDVALYLPVTKA